MLVALEQRVPPRRFSLRGTPDARLGERQVRRAVPVRARSARPEAWPPRRVTRSSSTRVASYRCRVPENGHAHGFGARSRRLREAARRRAELVVAADERRGPSAPGPRRLTRKRRVRRERRAQRAAELERARRLRPPRRPARAAYVASPSSDLPRLRPPAGAACDVHRRPGGERLSRCRVGDQASPVLIPTRISQDATSRSAPNSALSSSGASAALRPRGRPAVRRPRARPGFRRRPSPRRR